MLYEIRTDAPAIERDICPNAEDDAAVGGLSRQAEAGENQASGLVVYQFPQPELSLVCPRRVRNDLNCENMGL
jgi:hypothetical protein